MERRDSTWPEEAPRQRREAEWPADVPRQRRRPRWGEFRDAYPRIVAGMVFGMALLLAADAFLLVKRWRYGRELAALRAAMSERDREKADALLQADASHADLQAALARQQAVVEKGLNLAVSREEQVMHLQREGARLRTMKVQVGADAPPAAQGAPRVVAPLGRRTIVRVVEGGHPSGSPLAIVLDDGSFIYASPRSGRLADASYVPPGAVRAELDDLRAIRENLAPGVPVYFH